MMPVIFLASLVYWYSNICRAVNGMAGPLHQGISLECDLHSYTLLWLLVGGVKPGLVAAPILFA